MVARVSWEGEKRRDIVAAARFAMKERRRDMMVVARVIWEREKIVVATRVGGNGRREDIWSKALKG